ncbi:hypothetical protein [Klebsiella oxytoca]|uniref:hypothetical protein n=1 Tax=Klebsiella oxytoca TaxID=571 RepID=UPI002A0A9892|nr:hypothetical protein [Klebsiella oxytoca]
MDNKISINKIIADIKATKGNRSGCQGLSSTLESDGYITSICKWVRATSPDRINALVEHVEKQDAALIAWEKTMMEVCGEDGPASVASEIRNLRALRDTALTALRAQVKQLAAENVQARERHSFIRALAISILEHSGGRHDWRGAMEDASDLVKTVDEVYSNTPATDRIVAGIKADGRVEGAHFVANRMLAAWDAGFIEDSAKNAADIACMILTSTEFMADAPEGDFDRSFADGILEYIAQLLREGADK